MEQYLQIGMIANTHGVKGEIKVMPLTDNPNRFEKLKNILVDKNGSLVKYSVEQVKYFKGFVIIKLKEINSMDEAERLKGLYIKIDRENAVKLPKNSFFICDLIGCEVFEENSKKLGVLKEVLKTGSNDVYVVKGENNSEILVPALKSVVKSISVEDRIITVKLPEGLVDDEV